MANLINTETVAAPVAEASERIRAILGAKERAGGEAHMVLFGFGGEPTDCILWPSEDASAGDDGAHACGRWDLTRAEAEELLATGAVDEVN